MSQHEESTEHFFASFTDLLVGVIFMFMMLMMVFALNFKQAETTSQKAAARIILTEQVRAELLREIAARMQARGLPVTMDLQSGVIRLPESLLFSSGEWELSEQGQQVVAALAQVLGELLPCATPYGDKSQCGSLSQEALLDSVLVEGHTDKQPFNGTNGMSNWELSAFRAITVYKAMVGAQPALEQGILNPSNQPILGVSAYAERRPVDTATLDPNRRIDVRFNMRAPNMQTLQIPTPAP